jgi:hypothetical protein
MPKGSREIPILSKQELPITVSGSVASEMAMVNSSGQMARNTSANGRIIERMAKVNSLTSMVTSMKEIG